MEPETETENDKNLSIKAIPNSLYWAIIALKTKHRAETWINFLDILINAKITPKEQYIPTLIDPCETILVNDIPRDTFYRLKSLKAELKAKTWVEFLAIIAVADIDLGGATRSVSLKSEQEAP